MRVCSFCQRCYDDSAVSCVEASHPVLTESRAGGCEMIAGYHLEFLLESGGTYDLYRARHSVSGHSCFVRIISANENDSQRFLHDAMIASALFHPNVTGIYDTGVTETGVYVVTEDAGGQTLREHLSTAGAPPLLTAVQIARQAAEALDAIHSSGSVHCAVRPENIVLATDHDGQLLVRIQHPDLGGVISRSVVSDKFLIETALGSIKYFAPEQFSGDDATAQTDVYSLGVVFYEMIAGIPPFESVTAAGLIHKHRNEPLPEFRIDNFDLRMLITYSLTESLHKQPRTRTPSAIAFARQLRHIEQLATHNSTPPPAVHVSQAMPATVSVAAASAMPARQVESVPAQPSAVVVTDALVEGENLPVASPAIENQPVVAGMFEGGQVISPVIDYQQIVPAGVENDAITSSVPAEMAIPIAIGKEPEVRFTADEEIVNDVRPEEEESKLPTASDGRSEPEQIINLIISVPDLPLPDETASPVIEAPFTESPAEEATESAPQRSRMKHVRRKLHLISALHVDPETEDQMPLTVEPAEVNIVQVESEPEEISFIPVETEMADVMPIHMAPKMIEWDLPDDDIPSLEEVLEVREQEQFALPIDIETFAEIDLRENSRAERILTAEDHMLVEMPLHTGPDEFQFLSSVIRDVDGHAPSEPKVRKTVFTEPADSIFAAYGEQRSSRMPVGYRSLMIGGGFVAAIALFLGSDTIKEQARSEKPAVSTVTRSEPERKPMPRPEQESFVEPETQTAPASYVRPQPDDSKAVADRSTPSVEKSAPLPTERPQHAVSSAKVEDRAPNKPEPEEREVIIAGKKRPIRSTLVISANNGKIESRLESKERTADSTRPRIVVQSGP